MVSALRLEKIATEVLPHLTAFSIFSVIIFLLSFATAKRYGMLSYGLDNYSIMAVTYSVLNMSHTGNVLRSILLTCSWNYPVDGTPTNHWICQKIGVQGIM
jgi:hypothetical protein